MKTPEAILKKIKNLELKYGKIKDFEKIKKIIETTKKEEEQFHKNFFWNYESNRWDIAINKRVRQFIKKELKVKGRILDFGAGSFCYVNRSVACDLSYLMLKRNESRLKVLCHFHKKSLPFKDAVFDSVLLIFVVDYIKNLNLLFSEIKRVLKKKGKVVVVQSNTCGVYNEMKKKQLSQKQLEKVMRKYFKINSSEKIFQKKKFLFVVGEK